MYELSRGDRRGGRSEDPGAARDREARRGCPVAAGLWICGRVARAVQSCAAYPGEGRVRDVSWRPQPDDGGAARRQSHDGILHRLPQDEGRVERLPDLSLLIWTWGDRPDGNSKRRPREAQAP